jgi:hypothetical protein
MDPSEIISSKWDRSSERKRDILTSSQANQYLAHETKRTIMSVYPLVYKRRRQKERARTASFFWDGQSNTKTQSPVALSPDLRIGPPPISISRDVVMDTWPEFKCTCRCGEVPVPNHAFERDAPKSSVDLSVSWSARILNRTDHRQVWVGLLLAFFWSMCIGHVHTVHLSIATALKNWKRHLP